MAIKIANTTSVGDIAKSGVKKNFEKSNISFSEQLEDVSESKYQDTLIELTKNIFEQGELVAQKCDIKEFKKYNFESLDVDFVHNNLIVHNLCDDYFISDFLEDPKKNS